MSLTPQEAARMLRGRLDLEGLSPEERRFELRLALMELRGANVDDHHFVRAVEHRLMHPESLIAEVKEVTRLSDNDIAKLAGRQRPTIQAYRTGRLCEHLEPEGYNNMARVVRKERDRMNRILERLEQAANRHQA